MGTKATAAGTAGLAQRFTERYPASAYRRQGELSLSTVGLGTYLGNADAASDQRYADAVAKALELGCNVFDTAINYRHQRSERMLGKALQAAFQSGVVRREEVFVSTKGGFIPFDGSRPEDPGQYFLNTFVNEGICTADDVVAGCHVMTPEYLEHQLGRSLENLQLDAVDLYYIHNPEIELTQLDGTEFASRMHEVFAFLEKKVEQGVIGCYGTATWNGYRIQEGSREYLSLLALIETAKEVAGDDHHFRYIQLPLNLGMAEAWRLNNQLHEGQQYSALKTAADNGINVMTSGSIGQGRLTHLPTAIADELGSFDTNAQRALNFTRSVPGVGTALVGMGRPEHVEENLGVLSHEPLTEEQLDGLFARPAR